jgi:hypothetical protein
LRTGATDEDLVEFFAYGWGHAAVLDLEAQRLYDAEHEARWQVLISQLINDAEEAEQAAVDASAEVAEQARAAAVRAWRVVGTQTGPARTAWAEAQEVAQRQAANWRAVAAAAAAATGPNWQAIAGTANSTQLEWTTQQTWAAGQAQFWNGLLDQAVAGETRMTNH